MMKIFNNTLIGIIKIYKFLFSPLLGQSCRYFPSCSDYCIETLKTHNFSSALFDKLDHLIVGSIFILCKRFRPIKGL